MEASNTYNGSLRKRLLEQIVNLEVMVNPVYVVL